MNDRRRGAGKVLLNSQGCHAEAKLMDALSYREKQMLDHVSKGLTNKEIADRLGPLSPSAAANRRIGLFDFKPEITPLPIPTNFAPLPGLTVGTVKHYVGHLFRKMRVRNRIEAIERLARDQHQLRQA